MSDNNAKQMNFNQKYILAIYGPMIYTALYVMLLMRANPLRGQVGGCWAGGNRVFFGSSEMASSSQANAVRGPKKYRFLGLGQLKYSLQPKAKQNKGDKFSFFRFFSHLIFRSNQKQIKVINFASFSLRFVLSENERRTL
jgi:hypothetical protein